MNYKISSQISHRVQWIKLSKSILSHTLLYVIYHKILSSILSVIYFKKIVNYTNFPIIHAEYIGINLKGIIRQQT